MVPTQLFPHPKDLMAGPAKSGGGPGWIRPTDDSSDIVQREGVFRVPDKQDTNFTSNADIQNIESGAKQLHYLSRVQARDEGHHSQSGWFLLVVKRV